MVFTGGSGVSARARHFLASSVIAIVAVAAQPAIAQNEISSTAAQEAQNANESASEAIVVTGSRLQRTTFNSPNPITVIDQELTEALGQVSAAETLQIVPQNANFQSNENIGFAAAQQQGNVGVSTANLRGLNPSNGGVRTLLLVDTRRFVPTTAGGGVDLNQIPSMLIKSTEVVTGGASAQYGTDAVAGVVNLILDKRLTGFKGQLDYGQTFQNDGKNWHGSFAYGTGFGGGRGHLIVGAEYSRDKGIGDCTKVRAWCADAWFVTTNELNAGATTNLRGGPAIPPNGLPRNLIRPNVKFSQVTLAGSLRGGVRGTGGIDLDTGLLTAPLNTGTGTATAFNLNRSNVGILEFQQFNDSGTGLMPYDSGEFPTAFGNAVGGSGGPTVLRGSESEIRIPSERFNMMGRAEWEFSSALKGFVEAGFSRRANRYATSSQGPQSFFVLNTNNAYLQCTNYDKLSNAQRATLALRQQNCTPMTMLAPVGTTIQTAGRIGVYGASELDAQNRLTVAKVVPITDLPSRRWNALRTDTNAGERYLSAAATAPYTSQGDFVAPTIGQFAWGKHMENAARPINTSESETFRIVAGFEGRLFSDWNWDFYYQYGKSEQQERLNNTRVSTFFKAAIDAVFAPDGSIQCNVLVDPLHPNSPNNPTNVNNAANNAEYRGCKPLNLIGLTDVNGRMDPEALAFAYRTQDNDVSYVQHVAAANVRGTLFEGWAGPLSAAVGVEGRFEKGNVYHGDPVPAWYDQFSRPQLGFPYSGELKIVETYAEASFPLLSDFVLAKRFEIGGAYRRTWQNNKDTTPGFEASKSIDFPTWKLNADWEVTDWFRFRATRSRDARAAGFRDLSFKGTPAPYGAVEGRLINRWAQCVTAGQVSNCNEDNARVTLSGNFTLLPEVADTWTVGAVFTPGGFAQGLRVSVDWYDIKIARAISSAGSGINAQGIIDQCWEFGNFCEFIQRDVGGNDVGPFETVQPGQPVTDIGFVRPVSQNLGAFYQRGFDIEVAYSTSLDRIWDKLPGNLSIRSVFTHVYDFIVDPSATVVGDERDYAGQSGAIGGGGPAAFSDFNPGPYWRSNHWITYKANSFSTTLGIRHIGPGKYNALWQQPGDPGYDPTNNTSIDDNTVDGSTIFSLAFSYEFTPFASEEATTELFLAMDNIFGKVPSVAPSGVGYSTNPTYFDTQGARWRAGIRVKF